jgi:3-(3-hydroxy-phenyl)propionate hydroxylase
MAQAETPPERFEATIVGAGPNGAALANFLGANGIRTLLVERSDEILPYPRAVGMDDEALRVFQASGLAEPLLRDMIQNVPLRYYNGRGVCFAEVKPATQEFGWPRRNIFMQPLAERVLRDGLARFESVSFRTGHELIGLEHDADGARLTLRGPDGVEYRSDCTWLVGADGGRSTVRGLLGIELEGVTHPRKWIVADAANDSLDAPYTALHADPARPFVCVFLPYRHRRWEFMLFDGEDEAEMSRPERVRGLIARHIGAGAAAALEIVRIRAYTHHSRVCTTFRAGRCVLVGDAAHLTPPWAGQGMNSGIRDVGNLGWKLVSMLRHGAHDRLIDSYDLERREHAIELIGLADNMGTVLGITDPLAAGVRDWIFQAVDGVPALREHIVQFKFKPMAHYRRGIVAPDDGPAHPDDPVGRMFVQPLVERADGQAVKLDEVLGPGFAVLGFRVDPAASMGPAALAFWQRLGARFVRVERARSGISRDQRVPGSATTQCVEDVHREIENWFAKSGGSIAMIRPDRFLAALTTPGRVDDASARLQRLIY